ncbi:MAG: CHASE domain-containing protein, partial [Rhodoferax sp.]|nr:CHASE domain-containing protein [Rhodoferax sp.]
MLGLIASVTLFSWVYRQEQRSERANFDRRTLVRVTAVQQGMSDATDAVRAINLFFVANGGNVSRQQFHAFAQPLRARYPYIAGFAYDRLVAGDERPAFEAQMRIRYPGFSITEMVDGKRMVSRLKDRYRVIDYMEPMAAGDAAFGLDVSSTPSRGAAIRRADSTGLPSATGLFPFAQLPGTPAGFRILMAVYKNVATPDAAPLRHREVAGYTVAVLRAGDVIEKILGPANSTGNAGLDVRLYAAASADDNQLVYGLAGATTGKAQGLRPAWLFGDPAESFAHDFDVAGTPWHMTIAARPTPFVAAHAGALAALLASLLTTLAGTAYLRAIATRTRGIQQLVEQRTRELTQTSEALSLSEARLRGIFDSATDAIITADESQSIVMANAAAAQMFRYAPGALIGAPLERLIPECHREMHRRQVQAFGDTQAPARPMGAARDVMGLRADGQEFPIDAAISHLNLGGRRL